jgi:uncharacterized sulfatase
MTRLYNLAADPTERTNLADRDPARAAQMKALLAAHQKGARKPLYPWSIEGAIAVDKTAADDFKSGDDYVFWPN